MPRGALWKLKGIFGKRGRLLQRRMFQKSDCRILGPGSKEEPTCFGCHTCVWKSCTTLDMPCVPRHLLSRHQCCRRVGCASTFGFPGFPQLLQIGFLLIQCETCGSTANTGHMIRWFRFSSVSVFRSPDTHSSLLTTRIQPVHPFFLALRH